MDSMSIAFTNAADTYVLNKICARRPVTNDTDQYFIYSRDFGSDRGLPGSSARARASVRLPGTNAAEAIYSLSTASYTAREYARRDFVSDKEIRKADSVLAPMQDAAQMLLETIANETEDILARIVCDNALYNAACKVTLTTGGSGTSWGQGSYASANSSPLGNLRTGRAAIIRTLQRAPNTLVLSDGTAQALADHPELKDILKYTDGKMWIEGTGLPEEIRGLNIVVASAVANTAAAGAAYSGEFIFQEAGGTNKQVAILCYVPPGKVIGARSMASFAWFDSTDQTTQKRGFSLRQWRDEDRKGFVVEASTTMDIRPIVVDGSSLITGAYLIRECTV